MIQLQTISADQVDVLRCLTDFETAEQFYDPELDKIYDTYLLTKNQQHLVLKKAQPNEVAAHEKLSVPGAHFAIPHVYQIIKDRNENWLLMEYLTGQDLQQLDRRSAELVGVALAKIASHFYEEQPDVADKLSRLKQSKQRASKLVSDPELASAYQTYLTRLSEMPVTFSHDDLLPINVLVMEARIWLIDWGYGRKADYINDVARFSSFFSPDDADFQQGFTFLDQADFISEFETAYFNNLTGKLKEQLTWPTFQRDLRLARLDQYLLNLTHLPLITTHSVESDWENFFYQKALQQAKIINAQEI